MHPIIKTLLISILIGLSFGTYLYFNYDHRPERIYMSLLSSTTIGTLMMLALTYRHYCTSITSIQSLKTIIMIGLLITAALAGTELTFLCRTFLWTAPPYQPFSAGNIYILNILIVLVTGIPIYISEEWKNILQSRITNQQYRVLQLEQQQTAFELELLRAKVNPHFLYNVHNTIAGLIPKDPQKAEELVLLLSRFFRFTLNKNSTTFHTVTDELEIITTYLHMQQIRYGNKMHYTIQAEPQTLQLQLPSFILQPLVENAVKHGIETSTANGTIQVTLSLQHNHLLITISDSGPPFPNTPGTGLGLQLIRNKLKLLYNTNFNMELNNTPAKHVRLTIPTKN